MDRGLVNYSPWGCKESETTCMLAFIYTSHKKPWGNVTSILPSEKSPSQRATCCTIPVIWHPTKGKTSRSVLFSRSVMSYSLQTHGLQHTRTPYPSPPPRTYSNSCSPSQWCHPAISSSVIPFSSCLQTFLASESFPVTQFFASGDQSIGVSASAWVLQWIFTTDFL